MIIYILIRVNEYVQYCGVYICAHNYVCARVYIMCVCENVYVSLCVSVPERTRVCARVFSCTSALKSSAHKFLYFC